MPPKVPPKVPRSWRDSSRMSVPGSRRRPFVPGGGGNPRVEPTKVLRLLVPVGHLPLRSVRVGAHAKENGRQPCLIIEWAATPMVAVLDQDGQSPGGGDRRHGSATGQGGRPRNPPPVHVALPAARTQRLKDSTWQRRAQRINQRWTWSWPWSRLQPANPPATDAPPLSADPRLRRAVTTGARLKSTLLLGVGVESEVRQPGSSIPRRYSWRATRSSMACSGVSSAA